MAQKLFRTEHDRRTSDGASAHDSPSPGKSTLTSRLRPTLFRAARGDVANDSSRDDRGVAGGAADHVDRAAGGSGSALPDDLRTRFEDSLGTDLSGVRVHTAGESASAADAVGAKAYTVGNDIHFGAGQYDPSSSAGQFLIAHEVAHTVQQAGASPRAQYKLEVSSAGDAFEVEADRAASAMVSGQSFALSGGGAGTVARKEKEKKEIVPSQKTMEGVSKVIQTADKVKKFKDGTVPFSLLGKEGQLSYGDAGITGSLKLGAASFGLGKPLDHSIWAQLGTMGGVFLEVAAKAKVSADASVSVSGSAPSGDPLVCKGTFTGSGNVGVSASGRVTVGGYLGAQILNLNAGGYLELAANASMPVSVSGMVQITENLGNTGSVTFKVTPKASVVAKGGITIGYNAVVTKDTLYEHEVGSLTIAEISVPCEATYDMKTGQTSQKGGDVEVKWLEPKLPAAKVSTMEKVAPAIIPAALAAGKARAQLEREKECEAIAQGEVDRTKRLEEHGVHEQAGYSENPVYEPQESVPSEELEARTAANEERREDEEEMCY